MAGATSGCYSVILPTYNERENLPFIVWLLLKHLRHSDVESFEILLVDDNSPDGTADVYRRLQKLYPEDRLLLLERPGKLGLGSAYIDGLRLVRGDFVFLMDADLSHHPRSIPHFIATQKEGDYDVVSGSRYKTGGGVCGWDLRRFLMSRVAHTLAVMLLNSKASDLTGSYRLYKRKVLEEIMPSMGSKGYVFQMEMLVRCAYQGYSIAEVPIQFVDRIYGESKLGAGEVTQYIRGLLRLFWTI
eukprot:GHVQ01008455.1.p1 GENE.GHVQ01008455.1~~GHVQ01008455.1.p1  ORF type:complete len:244 (+),score=24.72 GHVQ01008455.1:246-977(+)